MPGTQDSTQAGMNQESQNPEQQSQAEESIPSAQVIEPTYSHAQMMEANRLAAVAGERARAAMEQARQLEERFSQTQNQPQTVDYTNLDERLRTPGQAAQAMAELIRAEQDKALEPIRREYAETSRQRKIDGLIDDAIANSPYGGALSQYRVQLKQAVVNQLSGQEPTAWSVGLIVKGIVADAIAANPNFVTNPSTSTQTPPPVNQRPPLPPNIPNGRPLPPPNSRITLSESEKKTKERIAPDMSDEDFKAIYYSEGTSRSYDVTTLFPAK